LCAYKFAEILSLSHVACHNPPQLIQSNRSLLTSTTIGVMAMGKRRTYAVVTAVLLFLQNPTFLDLSYKILLLLGVLVFPTFLQFPCFIHYLFCAILSVMIDLRTPDTTLCSFKRHLKAHLFQQ